uniref:Uncharacterized protein n=1 Tax=Klebsiella phage vB-Kvc-Y10 TaxID=3236922 RepID=A0AB39CBZ9_9CAUD
MTKRTVKFDISVSGSAVVDIDHLLSVLKSVQNTWAQYLLEVYHSEGVDALAATYVRQAYAGGLNSQLRLWASSSDTELEHGGKAKFAPARVTTEIKPKRALCALDVPIGGRYKFNDPGFDGYYEGVFTRNGERSSVNEEGEVVPWLGHERWPIVLVV